MEHLQLIATRDYSDNRRRNASNQCVSVNIFDNHCPCRNHRATPYCYALCDYYSCPNPCLVFNDNRLRRRLSADTWLEVQCVVDCLKHHSWADMHVLPDMYGINRDPESDFSINERSFVDLDVLCAAYWTDY